MDRLTRHDEFPQLFALGDAVWQVQLGGAIDPVLHDRVMALNERIHRAISHHTSPAGELQPWQTIRECALSYCAVTVWFDAGKGMAEALGQWLIEQARACLMGNASPPTGRTWRLPVHFGGTAGYDLDAAAQQLQLSPTALIKRITALTLRVYMVGFMPGFPYMGSLPAELSLPRHSSPRQQVPPQSFAIAGAMCAVYPWASPGGWHLLGRTPVILFSLGDPDAPSLFSSGDLVCIDDISKEEFDQLDKQMQSGHLPRSSFLAHQQPQSRA